MSKKTREEKKSIKKIKPGRLEKKEAMYGYLFVAPWIVGALIFLVYTLATSFWYSLNSIRITPMGQKSTFIQFGNYTEILLGDQDFPVQILNYLWSTIISVPVIVVFALIIAILLNGKIKCKGLFRLIFFLPVIVVSGPVMNMLSEQGAASISVVDTKAITATLQGILPDTLASSIGDLFSNMVMVLWYSGVQILIFLSALQKIDVSQYEAAKIDGGSGWECFWKITLPSIKPMILLNFVYTVVFLSGNEQNSIINLIQDAMFSGAASKGYGYASAMAWIYSLIVVVIVALFALLLMARKDAYERKVKQHKKERKKELRAAIRVERRGIKNAKKIERARKKHKYSTYSKDSDY